MLNSKQSYLIGSPLYTLSFKVNSKKTGCNVKDVRYFTNNPLKDKGYLDPGTLKELSDSKGIVYITTPNSRVLYRAKLEGRAKTQGIAGIVSLIKERFNLDLTENKVAVFDADTGFELPDKPKQMPNEICVIGALKKDLKTLQTELADQQISLKKLQISSLLVPEALQDYAALANLKAPVCVVDFSLERSCIYMVSNGKILAAYPPTHGIKNLFSLGRKECNLPDDISIFKHLTSGIKDEPEKAKGVLQRVISDLKSYIDFFEVQNGVSLGNIFVRGTVDEMGWIDETLSQAIELPILEIDYERWLKARKISMPKNAKVPSKALFGMLSAIVHYNK